MIKTTMKKTENNLMMMMTITYDQGGPVVCVTVVALRIRQGRTVTEFSSWWIVRGEGTKLIMKNQNELNLPNATLI